MNTKQLGKLRMFVYRSGTQYIGVCLELNMIVWERTQKEAIKHLLKASAGYLETVIKENMPDTLLNEKVAFKYKLVYYAGLIRYSIRHNIKNFFAVEIPLVDGRYGIPMPA